MRNIIQRVVAWLAMTGMAVAQMGGEGFGLGPVSQFYNDPPYVSGAWLVSATDACVQVSGDTMTGLLTVPMLTATGAVSLATSGGNVGIGTNAPAAKLHVAGSMLVEGVQTNRNDTYLGTSTQTYATLSSGTCVSRLYVPNLGGTNYLAEGVFDTATGPLWTWGNNCRMVSGAVTVYATNKEACSFTLSRDGSMNWRTTTNGVASVPISMYLSPQGSLGIGTSAPAAKLHVDGNFYRDGVNGWSVEPVYTRAGVLTGTNAFKRFMWEPAVGSNGWMIVLSTNAPSSTSPTATTTNVVWLSPSTL